MSKQELMTKGEVDNDALAVTCTKMDAWTIKMAAFAAEKDGQLDTKEVSPK